MSASAVAVMAGGMVIVWGGLAGSVWWALRTSRARTAGRDGQSQDS